MRHVLLVFVVSVLCINISLAQTKTIIGIVPFKNSEDARRYQYNHKNQGVTTIQDAVTEAFLRTKRFSLVEREKMDQIKGEKRLQQDEDFIDGTVIEQSKSLGAQYIVTGNVSKATVETSQTNALIAGSITSRKSEVAFNIKVIDVTTGEIKASSSFSGNGRGKNSFQKAVEDVIPEIELFINENFRLTASIASVEAKNDKGDAVKVLIAAGSSVGMQQGNTLKVYEAKELTVDGKKMTRKITIGKIMVSKVEDDNFSVCDVVEGGADIAEKIAAKAHIKCEIIND